MRIVQQLLFRFLVLCIGLSFFPPLFGQDNCAGCEITGITIVNPGKCRYGFALNSTGCSTVNGPVWDYGDGSPTTSGLPGFHQYTSAGSYEVCATYTIFTTQGLCFESACTTLVVPACDDNCGLCAITPGEVVITQPNNCRVDVMIKNSSSACSLTRTFTYNWGDGTQFTITSPHGQHSYNQSGTYTVCVTETASNGTETCTYTYCRKVTVSNCNTDCATCGTVPGSIAISYGLPACQVNVTVTPSTSGCALSHFDYDFGDGTYLTSNSPTQSHLYNGSGNYIITVTEVYDDAPYHCNWIYVRQISVVGCASGCGICPITPGTFAVTTVTPCTVTAAITGNSSPCTTVNYVYDFGDGSLTQSSSSASMNHTYTSSGTFKVCVTETRTSADGQSVCTESRCQNVVVAGCADCTTDPFEDDFTHPTIGPSGCSGFQWNNYCLSLGDKDVVQLFGGKNYIVISGKDATVSGRYGLWFNCVSTSPLCVQIETISVGGSSTNTVLEFWEGTTLVATDDDGGTGLFSRIDYCAPMKAADMHATSLDWKIYPTVLVAGSSVQYQLPDGLANVHLTLMDVTGRMLQAYDVVAGKGSFKLPETVAPGMYFVRTNQASLATLRLIVQ